MTHGSIFIVTTYKPAYSDFQIDQKMETNFEVISEEMIKPSLETPHYLRYHELSELDRIQLPVYISIIFFYEANELNGLSSSSSTSIEISEKLKQSLSDTLTSFYPLAGKLDRGSVTVDCNDDGVMYVEARVHARVSEAIQDPSAKQLKLYVPVSPSNVDNENILLAVQINFFDCGGLAIGLCLFHQIGDGASAVMFMNAWAATCRGEVFPRPSFDLADHFTPNTDDKDSSVATYCVLPEVFVTKRIVFDKEKLAALRIKAVDAATGSSNAVKDPTRVELVSAFIWKHFAQAAISSQKVATMTVATQGVNMRKRVISPPCLENVFGNCYTFVVSIFDHKGGYNPEIHDLVPELRNSIRALNDESIRKLQSTDNMSMLMKGFEQLLSTEGVEWCSISSWCRFPAYDVDYGWGKPVWVGTTGFPAPNSTTLIDNNSSGDGIEAWINALPQDIETLESKADQLLSSTTVVDM